MIELFAQGAVAVLSYKTIILIAAGVTIGVIFGLIPGLTATMAVALFLPLTFEMNAIESISLLIGLYIGGISGGLIPAILLNIPGTPASIATTFDGYPMARKGEAKKALQAGVIFSFTGGLLSIILLIVLAPPLAGIALKFTPFEYFAVTIFSLTMIANLSSHSLTKGLLSGLLGIALALVGSAPIDAYIRFTFGIHELDAGFSLLPVLIGLFGISEILKSTLSLNSQQDQLIHTHLSGSGIKFQEITGQTLNCFRSGLIGVLIGILPGIGAATSNMLAYITARTRSQHPEKFGTGVLEGLVASESANNASVGGALIPLLTLGIPGDSVTAMLLGGFMIHGLAPGPMLFKTNGDIIYGIFTALIIANFFMLLIQLLGVKTFVQLLKIPKHLLLPVIISLCVVGCYGLNNRIFDVWTLLFFGILGFALDKLKFPLPPLILGFILGPIAERSLRRGLMLSNGNFIPFLAKPIAAFFLVLALLSVLISIYKKRQYNQ